MSSTVAAIVVAVITALGSFAGVYVSNRKSQALIAYRLEELEKRVAKHNNVVERMFRIEGRMDEAEHDIRDLKARA